MYFEDHNPPHFHVRYNNFRAVISINDLSLMEGKLSARVLGLVMEWTELQMMMRLRGNLSKLLIMGTSKNFSL